ncbi:MAG: ethanolamine ammonia-lyase subunit EutC [Planctomycetota bacterium]|nr:ethanolamine ammonia-lyase subunit EutC [Planctomycetota bacterium]MDA1211457.1 ethanolamine ammonia-lyase subunit EutC [Planctomycetota bacterium]
MNEPGTSSLQKTDAVHADAWHQLRVFTAARIALGRSGGSLPTSELLDFGLAHARARDAVHAEFEPETLTRELSELGIPCATIESCAHDRWEYLRRPDLGRQLSDASRERLNNLSHASCDLSIVISDGLSATAAHQQAVPLLKALWPRLQRDGWNLAQVQLVRFGRVAIQDEIGKRLDAQLSLMLIGERPGLGSPNSLGAYFVFQPQAGKTDADRNCVSNIRKEGLSPEAAAETLYYLLSQSRQRKLSGVQLKDDRMRLISKSSSG